MNLHEDPFLKSLSARLMQPGVLGLAVVGSYARGEHTAHSDIDLDIFVESLSGEADYTLTHMEGRLVSLKYLTIVQELESLGKPQKAIWAVPGLRQMVILTDDTGAIANLKQAAQNFNWQAMQPAADEYAAEELMSCAEEIHKIVHGLSADNESKVLYAVWGLFRGLANAVAVQQGMMMTSENRYFDIIQQTIGATHPWTKSFRLALGADIIATQPAYITRGKAALDLYRHTAVLFQNIIPEKHRDVIENTLQLLDSL